MMQRATGTFQVRLTPQPLAHEDADRTLGRRAIDKQFSGDLEGTGTGEMLSAGTVIGGSAGYVAIEWVAGTLRGLTGTFVLQHSGVMDRGAGHLSVNVVPDSGTGDLTGLSGQLSIEIVDGRHHYTFDYTLP